MEGGGEGVDAGGEGGEAGEGGGGGGATAGRRRKKKGGQGLLHLRSQSPWSASYAGKSWARTVRFWAQAASTWPARTAGCRTSRRGSPKEIRLCCAAPSLTAPP